MAEAEDVITDAARHATIYARDLWQRNRSQRDRPAPITLADVAPRLDLLITAIFGQGFPLRIAQPPAIPTLLTRLFRRHDVRPGPQSLPATDGRAIWLPNHLQTEPRPNGRPDTHAEADTGVPMRSTQNTVEAFRTLALLQAMRAQRGSAETYALAGPSTHCPRTRAAYLLLEAQAGDRELVKLLPGMTDAVAALRRHSLVNRPSIALLPPACRPLEELTLAILRTPPDQDAPNLPPCRHPRDALTCAADMVEQWARQEPHAKPPHTHALVKDFWTGELIAPLHRPLDVTDAQNEAETPEEENAAAPRSARMQRRPRERDALDNEDQDKQGTWMVQTNAPLEKAEDPLGLQRPADMDEDTPPDEFADALSELPEARLVSSPGKPREVLLSDDPPDKRSALRTAADQKAITELRYPEWDYRIPGYRHPGATVRLLEPSLGPQAWIDRTLTKHRGMLNLIRKRFEMLRAERVWLRRQLDGDEIDLQAYIEGIADVRAGLPMPQALYRQQRPETRNTAIMLLIDISGSTDSWLSGAQRIIDVEREALLLVGVALEHTGQPWSIQAFSGEGPQNVTLTPIKPFTEPYSNTIAQRIAALEPQHHTRAGAALRHATALLMQQPAQHRLLILLSDGKPNDVDEYEGRYGIEDMRRAVEEAKAQGVFPFCLTIDRQAAGYLPKVFGARQYALLGKPEALPTVLLDWMRRLAVG